MKYKPLGQRVIVEVLPFVEKKTENGLVIDSAEIKGFQAKRLRGKVIEVGPLVTAVKKEDLVIFEDFAGVPLDYTKPDTVWMEEDQIVAIEGEE